MFVAPLLLLAGCGLFDGPSRPNVLLVVWDTARADRMSLYGHEQPTTPRLDARAASGRVFDRAWSPSSWTVPSHASFFTGLPPHVHLANGSTRWLAPEHVTLAEQLSAADYATWLFTANPNLVTANLHQGFATVATREDHHDEVVAYNHAKLHPDDTSTEASPGYRGPKAWEEVLKDAGPLPARLLGEWVGQQQGPWFAVVNYMEVHRPRLPTQAARDAVIPADRQESALRVRNDAPAIRQLNRGAELRTSQKEALLSVYDATMWDLDRLTEELFVTLEAQGALANTWVVLVSDHGENFGEHGHYGHSHDLYEPLVHVPLIVWGPDLTAGRVPEAVSTTHVYDLIRQVTGLTEAAASDLMAPRDEAVVERTVSFGGDPDRTWAIRSGDEKLITRPHGRTLFFDLAVDPDEEENLFPIRVRPRDRLQERFDRWLSEQPPPLATTSERGGLSEEMAEELRALGYVE